MSRVTILTIERTTQLLERIGFSRSTLHERINAKLWCPPISLGGRAVGYLRHESDELIAAYANEFSPEELRGLVAKLVIERKGLMGGAS